MKSATRIIFYVLILLRAGAGQPAGGAKLSFEEVSRVSRQLLAKAVWYRQMPQFNHDSTIRLYNQAVALLESGRPVQYKLLAEVYQVMTDMENLSYPQGIMDSLGARGYAVYQQVPVSQRDPWLEYTLLSNWAISKIESGDPRGAVNTFTKAISLVEDDLTPERRARIWKDKAHFYLRNSYEDTTQKNHARPYLWAALNYYKLDRSAEGPELYSEVLKLMVAWVGSRGLVDSTTYYLDLLAAELPKVKNPLFHAWYYSAAGREAITPIIENGKEQAVPDDQFETGKSLIRKSIAIMDKYRTFYSQNYPYCFGLLADMEMRHRNFRKAIEYYTKARDICIQMNYRQHASALLEYLSSASDSAGDLRGALEYSRKFHLESVAYEHETSEKGLRESELKLDVLGKEKMLAQQESERNSLLVVVSGVGFVVVLLSVVLIALYRNFKNKRKLNDQLAELNKDLGTKNSQLDKRNAENELLLKEIHHRVKNNLEIVSGLLALQAAQLENPSAQAVMQASQNRVLSMGIIHQKLYQKGNLAAIEMQDYFHNLGESVLDAFNVSERVRVTTAMEPLEVDVDTAVPVGLIANELMCNSLKYAFPDGRRGNIVIGLCRAEEPFKLRLSVSDDGIGKPEHVVAKGTGFGTELVNLLVAQLEGSLVMDNSTGTSIVITFRYKPKLTDGHID